MLLLWHERNTKWLWVRKASTCLSVAFIFDTKVPCTQRETYWSAALSTFAQRAQRVSEHTHEHSSSSISKIHSRITQSAELKGTNAQVRLEAQCRAESVTETANARFWGVNFS
jgi:hypothetical protein